ncbi:hypothetical protein BB561_003624 [Smittium simulii]|uniref:AAA+ ATPase domain-containing protein n=1 Tax=Smittium simulii TaxID=133385 RepID=A0A2T9YK90_9FUNG|nr:hypothetical protein BB561_003624 [Smittium simulii]
MTNQIKQFAFDVSLLVITQIVVYYGFKYVMSKLDPEQNEKSEITNKGNQAIKQLQLKNLKLNQYEKIVASEVVFSEQISEGFSDIGGIDKIIESLKESVIYPLTHPHLFNCRSGLIGTPKGVLLYGPPGCGKTMLAKALAKESGARFINLRLSTLLDKWYGESNKLAKAVFTLAEKLEPCLVFIDEVDSFLRNRNSDDHEATSMMKAEFMSLWDGLTTNNKSRVILIGATNRPNDIDLAMLRRMPKRFYLQPPNEPQRVQILKILLKDVALSPHFDFVKLAKDTQNMSGSDIKEVCRSAAMNPIYEYIRKNPSATSTPFNYSQEPTQDSQISQRLYRHVENRDFEMFLNQNDSSLLTSYNINNMDIFNIDQCD